MREPDDVREWAHRVIEQQAEDTANALRKFCRKPRSPERLHSARKALARLRAALSDLGDAAAVRSDLYARVQDLHRRAGKVRDADVMLERVKTYAGRALGPECEEIRTLECALLKRRKKALRNLESLIDTMPALHA